MIQLPDFDHIDSLYCEPGMYRLDRWPRTAAGQIEFLKAVVKKFGGNAMVTIHDPFDGYPGYIRVD